LSFLVAPFFFHFHFLHPPCRLWVMAFLLGSFLLFPFPFFLSQVNRSSVSEEAEARLGEYELEPSAVGLVDVDQASSSSAQVRPPSTTSSFIFISSWGWGRVDVVLIRSRLRVGLSILTISLFGASGIIVCRYRCQYQPTKSEKKIYSGNWNKCGHCKSRMIIQHMILLLSGILCCVYAHDRSCQATRL